VAAADRALAGDPRSVDAWVTQAIVNRNVDPTDLGPAIRSLRQALALDPRDAVAWHFLAICLAESGDMDSAFQAWRSSIGTDPSYAQGVAFFALGHYWRHEYDSAAHWADSAMALEPTYLLSRSTVGYVAIERGEFARGKAAFEAVERLGTDVELVNAMAGIALAEGRAGNTPQARGMLQRAESLSTGYYSPAPLHTAVYLAQAYAGLGDADHAIAWLQRYAPVNDLHFQLHLRCDPPFAAIETDPRFRSLLVMPRPAGSRGC
jgi:tetratricopeptide (TPR) repeat protein